MGPFVSIGTGDSDLDMFARKRGNPRRAWANLKAATKKVSRTKDAHKKMNEVSHQDNREVFPYYRFDGGKALGNIRLDAWEGDRLKWLTHKRNPPGYKTLRQMEDAIAVYLTDRHIQQGLNKCAEELVRRRRLRMRHPSEWDRYASFSYYECDLDGCQKSPHNKASDFKEHLRSFHQFKLTDEALEDKFKQCRRIRWVYRAEVPEIH